MGELVRTNFPDYLADRVEVCEEGHVRVGGEWCPWCLGHRSTDPKQPVRKETTDPDYWRKSMRGFARRRA